MDKTSLLNAAEEWLKNKDTSCGAFYKVNDNCVTFYVNPLDYVNIGVQFYFDTRKSYEVNVRIIIRLQDFQSMDICLTHEKDYDPSLDFIIIDNNFTSSHEKHSEIRREIVKGSKSKVIGFIASDWCFWSDCANELKDLDAYYPIRNGLFELRHLFNSFGYKIEEHIIKDKVVYGESYPEELYNNVSYRCDKVFLEKKDWT